MIDLHLHVLPGVDDGPDTLDESAEMCRLAAADGCTALIATPHLRHCRWPEQDPVHLREVLERLRNDVGSSLEIRLGGELRIDSSLLEDFEPPRASTCIPLADSNYLLLEFSRAGVGPGAEALIHEIQLLGWRPILAHPEFIPMLANDSALMERLVGIGALFQVTAMSLTGEFGRMVRRATIGFIDASLVHFVASDAHGRSGRTPGLSRARREISRRWGDQSAKELTEDNPLAVLENREIGVPAPTLTR